MRQGAGWRELGQGRHHQRIGKPTCATNRAKRCASRCSKRRQTDLLPPDTRSGRPEPVRTPATQCVVTSNLKVNATHICRSPNLHQIHISLEKNSGKRRKRERSLIAHTVETRQSETNARKLWKSVQISRQARGHWLESSVVHLWIVILYVIMRVACQQQCDNRGCVARCLQLSFHRS